MTTRIRRSRPPAAPAGSSTRQSVNPALRGPVLLALHGGESSSFAARTAHMLAERHGLPLRVVTVVEISHAFSAMPAWPSATPRAQEDLASHQRELVEGMVGSVAGESDWSIDVRFGDVESGINRVARETDATLIVVDRSPQRGLRGSVAGERALGIVRGAPCPVLSVGPMSVFPPRVIIVPCDFSPASVRAAHAALLFAGDRSTVILVHVPIPIHLPHAVRSAGGELVGGDVESQLSRLRRQLAPLAPRGAILDTHCVDGSVASGVLSVVDATAADLIAVGTHGGGAVQRFFVGSTAAALLHRAPCSVLVSPRPGPAEFIRLELETTGEAATDDPSAWAEVLADITARNGGRVVDVEVDDPDIGAQIQVERHVLRGIDYDPAGRRVDVMLVPSAGDGHLTRTIPHVRSIAVTATGGDRDTAVEIAHDHGHTLVTFRD